MPKAHLKWMRIKWTKMLVFVILFQVTEAFVAPPDEQNGDGFLPLLLGSPRSTDRFPTNCHSFRDYRSKNMYYIDKTDIIYWLVQKHNRVLITRPRGSGRTTMLSMLDEFFNMFKNSSDLFWGLKISKINYLCRDHQNKYPVIYIDFKDVGKPTFPEMEQEILSKVRDAVQEVSDKMSWKHTGKVPINLENELFRRNDRESGLATHKVLQAYQLVMSHFRDSVVLIDNYDVPFLHAFNMDRFPNKSKGDFDVTEFYSETQDLMKNILRSIFRVYPRVAVVTGIFEMEEVFPYVYPVRDETVLVSETYGSFFGFTKTEVQHLIQESGSSISFDQLDAYYGGYHHGASVVYNPLSVMSALSSNKLRPYRPDRKSLPNVLEFIQNSGFYGLTSIRRLVMGWSFETRLNPHLYYHTIATEEDTFWALLAHSGYIDFQQSKARLTDMHTLDWYWFNIKISNTELKEYLTSNLRFPNFSVLAESLKHQNQTALQMDLTKLYANVGPYFKDDVGKSVYQRVHFFRHFILCVFPSYNVTEFDDVQSDWSFVSFEVEGPKTSDNGENYIFSVSLAPPETTEAQMAKILKAKIKHMRGTNSSISKSKNATGVLIVFKGAVPYITLVPKVSGLFGWLEWLDNYVKTKWA